MRGQRGKGHSVNISIIDYVYQSLLEHLQKMRRRVEDLATDAKRIELQLNHSQMRLEKALSTSESETESAQSPNPPTSNVAPLRELIHDTEVSLQRLTKLLDEAVEEARTFQRSADHFRSEKETLKALYRSRSTQLQSVGSSWLDDMDVRELAVKDVLPAERELGTSNKNRETTDPF
jgi:hypothetical protein